MRKTIALLFYVSMLVFSSDCAIAQNTFKIDFGVINSRIHTENIPNIKTSEIQNFYFSAGFGKYLNRNTEVYIEAQYLTKGYTMRFGQELIDAFVYNFNYISLLPQIQYRPFHFLGISTGLEAGYKVAEKSREANWVVGPWNKSKDIKTMDFSWVVGVHFHFRNFYLKVLSDRGFQNISKLEFSDEQGNIIEDAAIKNRSIQVGFGYYILG